MLVIKWIVVATAWQHYWIWAFCHANLWAFSNTRLELWISCGLVVKAPLLPSWLKFPGPRQLTPVAHSSDSNFPTVGQLQDYKFNLKDSNFIRNTVWLYGSAARDIWCHVMLFPIVFSETVWNNLLILLSVVWTVLCGCSLCDSKPPLLSAEPAHFSSTRLIVSFISNSWVISPFSDSHNAYCKWMNWCSQSRLHDPPPWVLPCSGQR